jgi:Glycosyl hydrolase family 26
MSSTRFPLGVYVGNPNGNDPTAEAAFQSQYNAFVTDMGGARPQFMDTFVDYTQDPSEWGANASWTAWSWAMTGNDYVGPGSGTVPVVGVPLASNAGGWGNVDTFYQQIIAGDYDADYKAIVDAWAAEGYTTVQFRVGYEFNGNFMAWGSGNSSSPTVDADFVAAFQHVANLIHEEGAADGITAQVVWNPDDINSGVDPTQLYPGSQYVDIISTDAYSPAYPLDLTTWSSATATTPGPQASSDSAWAANTTDLEHYWQYTNGMQSDPTPALGDGNSGWSMEDAIEFAKEMGKPLSISETGAGSSGSGLGPSDDPAFVEWLASALTTAEAEGVTIQNVDIWDTDVSDGSWGFSNGERPLEEAAWGEYFGASATTATPTIPVVTIGSGADTLALTFSQDAWEGNAQFTVSVDGEQIGGTQTVNAAALQTADLAQTFDVCGNFSAGSHVVSIDFLNATSGGSSGSEEALFLTGASINGSAITGATLTETTDGPQIFTFTEDGSASAQSVLTFTDSNGDTFAQQVIASGSLNSYSYETGLNNNVHQWVDAADVHNISTDAWAYVTTVSITDNTGASYAAYDFVEVDANLTGAATGGQAATLAVNTAERGTINLGSGNYDVSFTAANAWGAAAENTVNLIMGSGNDIFSLTGSNGVTDGVAYGGSGTDQMNFIGTDSVTVYGGAGTATVSVDSGQNTFIAGTGTLNVVGEGSADSFVFHVGDGLMNIGDFNAAQGDTLNVDASLMSTMQETAQAGGLMISFGADQGSIMLRGVASLSSSSIHAIS